MKKQEAIKKLIAWKTFGIYLLDGSVVEKEKMWESLSEALDMAIEALSKPLRQGQRDGLISRQDVYDLIDNWDEPMISKPAFRCDIEDLSDAQTYTESEIQTMQDLEQAQLDKAYELGWKEGREALEKEMWEYGRDRLD